MLLSTLVKVENLIKYFPMRKGFFGLHSRGGQWVHAVDDISFSIRSGEIFSIVGESGSGKTTTGRLLMRLIEPTSGTIWFDGENLTKLTGEKMRRTRRNIQMIFQDPSSSLNPRKSVLDIVGLPLEMHQRATGPDKKNMVLQLLEKVKLTPSSSFIDRFPHELSGGQKQRVGIARALALSPKFIVADEPVSSLDVSIRSQILTLMQDLKDELNLTYLMIAHDLSVVRYMSTQMAIMYLGEIVEMGNVEDIFENPKHRYTEALLAAVPIMEVDAKRTSVILSGEMPSPINPPSGCRFHTRCTFAKKMCREKKPALEGSNEHVAACYFPPDS